MNFNPTALRMAKTLWSFGRSKCNRVKRSMVTPPCFFKYVFEARQPM